MHKIGLIAFWVMAAQALWGGEPHYVFLVTGDGIRHQEVFSGVDENLSREEAKKSSGIENVAAFRNRFWDEDPKRRREKVMPFFWGELSKQGVILGNHALGSKVVVRNPHHFSYPGYAEILNGQPLPSINSNDSVWSPRETVLQFVRRKLGLKPRDVAMFGSWEVFNWICTSKEGEVFSNAGYRAMPEDLLSGKTRFWSELQFNVLSPWDTVRHDVITLQLALEYIRSTQPRFVYLALGETDDWAHNRRYDRTVQTLHYFDQALKELWTLVQSQEPFRGRSTLIVTTDHGRGRGLEDWTSHGKNIPGADEAWLAIFGPGIPGLGEVSGGGEYSLSNVAATVLQRFGLDPAEFNPEAAPPVDFSKLTRQ